MALKRVVEQAYTNETVQVDGNRYENCIFEGCLIQYAGLDEVAFVNCRLNNVNWSFVGPAANTISFLSMLHNGFGPLGQELVENLFNNIRNTTITPPGANEEPIELAVAGAQLTGGAVGRSAAAGDLTIRPR